MSEPVPNKIAWKHLEQLRKQVKRFKEARKYVMGVYNVLHDRMQALEVRCDLIEVHIQLPAVEVSETESSEGVDD